MRLVRVANGLLIVLVGSVAAAQGATLPDGTQMPTIMGSQIPSITNNPQFSPLPSQQDAPKTSGVRAAGNSALNQTGQEIDPLGADRHSWMPEPKNEFQRLVEQSLGYSLPMYGYSLFKGVPSTFAPADRVPVTANYVIGPGDEIMLKGWGQVDIDYRATVDRNGAIYIPKVGNVVVAGVQYQNLQGYLKSRINRVFRNFDLNVSMGQLRSVQVMVVGEARRPGTYTVSSLSTLVNALFAAGGPSVKGSMRHIQLRRNNRLVTDFDLYDVLLRGDKSHDVRLMPGDVIYIQPVGPLVAVSGSVNVPAIYEMKGNETLEDLLRSAGGLSTTASARKVTVERIVDHLFRETKELALNGSGARQRMHDGDLVRVQPISPKFVNTVTLRGNVATPMRASWQPGMRVKDLIPDMDALIVPGYWKKKNAMIQSSTDDLNSTINSDGLDEQGIRRSQYPGRGKVQYLGQDQNQWQAQYQGQDQNQGQDQYVLNTRGSTGPHSGEELRTEIKHGSADVNWDYAVIQRLNKRDLTTSLIPFNLGRAVLDNDPNENKLLEPGDVITIFSKDEIKVPEAKQTMYVRLEGEVAHPGIYQIRPGETLQQLVASVGGFSPNAYLYGAEFTRESTRVMQQKNMDEMIDRLEHQLRVTEASKAQNALSADDAAATKAQLENGQALISKLKQTKATGRIVLELQPSTSSVTQLPNLALRDGDRFYVPPMPSTVSVLGSVYNQNAFIYQQGYDVGHYLQAAGGPTTDANAKDVYIIRADGSVVSQHQSGWFGSFSGVSMYPGDTVVVPEQLDKTTFIKSAKDWTQILYQFGLGIAGLKTLR